MPAMYEQGPMTSDFLSRHFDRQRDATQRPSSQPAPILRRPLPGKRQHSRNLQHSSNTTSKDPVDTHVITSIIASLDGIDKATVAPSAYTPSIGGGGGDSPRSSTKGSSLSRASSRRAPSVSAPVLRRSISLGVDHGAYTTRMRSDYDANKEEGEEEEDFEDDDAAAFPVIRTSRRPSGKSPHTASPLLSPVLSPTSSLKDIFRSPSRSSRNSRSSLSLGASDNPRPRLLRSNFSGDTLSKRLSNASQLSLESKTDRSTRKPSRETLRPATIREERVSALVIDPSVATRVEQGSPFSTLPPTPTLSCTSPTGRLYLDDSAEDTFGLSSQESGDTQAIAGGLLDDAVGKAIEEATALPAEDNNVVEKDITTAQPSISPSLSKASSPKKNPITDAIPLRVSSLNRTPPPRQKKSKATKSDKGKRVSTSRSPWQRSSRLPKETAQNLLEGLDQEDTTVKRIRELQRKREDRLNNESAAAAAADYSNSTTHAPSAAPVLPNPSSMSTDAKLHVARPSSRPNGDKLRPKTANKAQSRSADGRKAHKVLGLDGISKSAEDRNSLTSEGHSSQRYQSNHSSSPELNKRRLGDTPNQNALSSRPLDFRSHDSISQQPLDNRHYQHEATLSRRASTKSRLLNGLDLQAPDLTPPSTSHSTRSRRSRSNSNNLDFWSHPDVAGQNSGSIRERRKSMSDARHERVLEEEFLEERRNSVHTAVEDYLAAPRLNQKVRTAVDGRLISFSEVGDPRGAAVIVCVGMGLTRFVTAFYDELAATLGLRLITLDRPGVGESEPYPERERIGPLSWPDDVVTVTQHLGISKFSILAHSAGAIYALATALILPHCIKGKVHLLAPWIPPSQFDTYGIKSQSPDAIPVGALPRSQRLLRVLPIPFFKAANGGLFSPSSLKPSSVRTSPVSSPSSGRDSGRNSKPKKRVEPLRRENAILMEQVLPEKPVATMFPLPDLSEEDASGLQPVQPPAINLSATAFPTDPEFAYVAEALNAAEHSARARQSAYSSLLTERTWIVATRNSNPAVDLLVCLERNRDIGFRYVDIQKQITITHGSEDKRVPAENIKWIGEQINRRAATNWNPDAKQEFRERGGCEVRILPGEGHGLMASAIVMADVLSEIAGEWLGRSKW